MDESERVRLDVESLIRRDPPGSHSTKRAAGRDLNRLRAEQARRKAAEAAARKASKQFRQPKR